MSTTGLDEPSMYGAADLQWHERDVGRTSTPQLQKLPPVAQQYGEMRGCGGEKLKRQEKLKPPYMTSFSQIETLVLNLSSSSNTILVVVEVECGKTSG